MVCAAVLALSGCGDDTPEIVETTPSVKVATVTARTSGQLRQISGKVEAAETADLSFPISGTISEMLADPGQRVTRGQILARLDPQNYKLAVTGANAKLSSARAELAKERDNLRRQKSLSAKKLVAAVTLEKSEAAFAAAEAGVAAAQSELARARRDSEKTALLAPFDGVIAERKVDNFQEVKPGASVFVLQGGAGFEAKVLVPETMIRQVSFGQAVKVSLPTINNQEIGGTVDEISNQAEAGNAFPVSISLADTKTDLRPGMTVRVTFDLQREDGKVGFLIPLSAIALTQDRQLAQQPATEDGRPVPMFVLDEATSVVRKRIVRIGGVRGNLLEVFDGLKAGEKVVVAGVAFLRDGMKARAWQPDP